MKLIFMGTPEIAVPALERLIADGHKIVAVFTQPDRPSGRGSKLTPPPVKTAAQRHSLSIYQPIKIKTEEIRQLFESFQADVGVVVAYGRILPPYLLSAPRYGCINVHFSLLPKYRGAAPVNWAIANGETVTGVTTMQMDEGLDTGDILLQRSIEIGPDETAPELAERLASLGAEVISETVSKLSRAELAPIKQDDSQATLAPMLKREDGLIQWTMTAQQISNRVRGFQPWPGVWTIFNGARLIIWRAHPVGAASISLDGAPSSQAAPGRVVELQKDKIIVACGQGTRLSLEELQLEGKRRLPARDFLNGVRLKPGERLGPQEDAREASGQRL